MWTIREEATRARADRNEALNQWDIAQGAEHTEVQILHPELHKASAEAAFAHAEYMCMQLALHDRA